MSAIVPRLGDSVFYWWDTNAFGPTQVTGTVVRLNRVTVVIQWDNRERAQSVRRDLFGRHIQLVNWAEA